MTTNNEKINSSNANDEHKRGTRAVAHSDLFDAVHRAGGFLLPCEGSNVEIIRKVKYFTRDVGGHSVPEGEYLMFRFDILVPASDKL